MTFSNDRSDSNRTRELSAAQESHAQLAYLEIARRIARETLEADHQALELDPPSWPIASRRTGGEHGAVLQPSRGS
jgi:hypothetical protein